MPYGATISVKDGDPVKAGQRNRRELGSAYPSMVSEVAGTLRFVDFVDSIARCRRDRSTTHRLAVGGGDRSEASRFGGQKPASARPSGGQKGQGTQAAAATTSGAVLPARPGAIVSLRNRYQVGMGDMICISRRKPPRKPATLPVVCRVLPTCSSTQAEGTGHPRGAHQGIIGFGKDAKGKQRLIITDKDGNAHERS